MIEFNEMRLGEIFDIEDGDRGANYPKQNEFLNEGYCLFLNAGNVTQKGFLFTDNQFITFEKDQRLRKGKLRRNDIVVTTRGTVGNIAYYDSSVEYDNIRINSGMVILRNRKELSDTRYLYQYLRSPIVQSLIKLYSSGSAQPQLPIKDLKRIKLSLPNLEVQNSIANTLSAYDTLILNNNQRISVLEQMVENLYKEWFVRRKNENWELVKLSQFGYSLESGSRPKGGIDSSLQEGYPSLGAEAIGDLGIFDYAATKLIPEDFYRKMKRGIGRDKDILLYKDGAYIGKVTLFMDEFPYKDYAVNEHVFLMRSNNPIYQYYLYFTLALPQYFTQMQNLNRNAAQPGLTGTDIDILKLYLPDEETVLRFNATIEPMLHQIFSLAKQNENLKKQRDLLLPRLMSGKLEV